LADVFILSEFRGKGCGQFLVNEILNHDSLKGVRKWRLATQDAHEFYIKFGFSAIQNPEKLMEKASETL
jgi:N-acetylglutamate synthase-like GNAT family acetyltransferase